MEHAENLRNGIRFMRTLSPQIRASQIDLLLTVYLTPGITQRDLAIECNVSTSTISKAVDVFAPPAKQNKNNRLANIWRTERCSDDERLIQIYTTTEGQTIIKLFLDASYVSPLS